MGTNNAPYDITTDNPVAAIKQAAIKFGISTDKIEFNIQKVTTVIKDKRSKETRNTPSPRYEDLIDPYLMFSQNYELIMREIEDETIAFPEIVFANNSSHTTAYLIITKHQDLNLEAFTREAFLAHLEGILLRKKCFIRVDKLAPLSDEVDKLYGVYKVGRTTSKDIKIKVIEFPAPVNPVPDSLDLVYKKSAKSTSDGNDSNNKVKISSVQEGAIIIRYNKVVQGLIGRTYSGKVLLVSQIKPSHIPNFSIDPRTIRKEENNKHIIYASKETGFVFFENKVLRIDNQTEMRTANIRNQDKLITSLDDGVTINIKSKDKLSDAVAGNIAVKAHKVNINGNVGPSATVEGNIVRIGGQTHSKSYVKAKKGYIDIHKGQTEGEDITVNRLEGGSISAKNISVKIARGGHIKGETIIIDTIESNVKITASLQIQVKNITGESNTFTLKPLTQSFNKNNKKKVSLEDLINEEEDLEDEIKQQDKKLTEKLFLIEFNEKSLGVQRGEKIDKLRYNIRSSQPMDNKLKSYVKLQDEKDVLETALNNNKKKLEDIQKQIKDISSNAKNAFMEMGGAWTGGNAVNIHRDSKIYNFYPKKDVIKSPISFEILKKQNLIK